MGHRHMYGLAELQKAGLSPFELVAVCDPNLDNANSLADQARERLGYALYRMCHDQPRKEIIDGRV